MKTLTSLFYLLFITTVFAKAQNADTDVLPVTPTTNIPCTFVALVDVGGETDICPGASLLLSTPQSVGNTYQWLFNDELIPGANSFSYQATAAGFYAVIVYTRGCRGESLPVEVTVKNAAAFNPLPAQLNICGSEAQLNAGAGFVSYQWNNGSTDSTLQITSSGLYNVTIMDGQGCFFSDQISVSVIDFDLNQNELTVCAGSSVALSVSGNAISAGYNCSWIGEDLQSNGYQVSYVPVLSSWVTATVTDGQGACSDSIRLEVNPISNTDVQAVACDSYEWNGTTFANSGIYTYTTTAANGCDSIINLYLTINQSSLHIIEAAACQQFSWQGTSYEQSGSYTFQYNSSTGCDSTVFLHLTINQPSSSYYNIYSCGPYEWNGMTYTESGDYTVTAINAVGCDSTAVLHLTINNTSYSTTEIVSNEPVVWNGNTYTESGNYVYVTTNQAGCDSLAILDLIILAPLDCNIIASQSTVCSGQPVVLSAPIYIIPENPPGIPSRLGAISNRFSVRYTYLWSTGDTTSSIEVHPLVTTTYTVIISDGYSNCTGSYTVIVNQPSVSEETVSICNWVGYQWNGNQYLASGNYTFTTTNAAGCDSTAVLHLTINQPTSSESSVTTCGSYSWNGNVYSTSGDYTFTTTNAAGCDSTAVLHLTINQLTSSESSVTNCGSYSWNGNVYSTSGDYTFTTTNAAGCDSTAVLHLTINQLTSSESSVTNCGSYSWNGNVYSTSGDYTFTTTNAAGCDSTAVLHLTINQPTSSESSVTTCGSYSWNGNVYSTSGDYIFTTTNAAGCDSTEVLHLVINGQLSTVNQSATVCNQYQWFGTTYTSSGSYTHIQHTSSGCDTTYILELQILQPPVTPGAIQIARVRQCIGNRYVFSVAPVSGASSYQWNVSNGLTILSGQGTNSITVTATSSNNHCNNRTVCVSAINTCGGSSTSCIAWPSNNNNGSNDNDDDEDDDNNEDDDDEEENEDNDGNHNHQNGNHQCGSTHPIANGGDRLDFNTYPNPASHWLTVNSRNANIYRIEIIDGKGKIILQSRQIRQIPVSHLASGQYFLRVYSDKGVQSKGIFIIR